MGLGVYVSVPFCAAKCSFCNFASGVFGAGQMERYVARLGQEIREARRLASTLHAEVPQRVDTVYLGGGTPSLLPPEQIHLLFSRLREVFEVVSGAEVTVECAPGQLPDATLEAFQREGVNRLSFGVQSFVDAECAAVGRTHTGASCREELRRTTSAGIKRVGVDLICGLPHQTEASWRSTIEQAVESGVEHVSVYMLEVDEDSRLGREALTGGLRYGAATLPDEDRVADWYAAACEWLEAGGVRQYEISNFARSGGESRHNLKYWTREPYLGFGMEAHSMLRSGGGGVRWANADTMSGYVDRITLERQVERVSDAAGFEEEMFLGLRMVAGVPMAGLDEAAVAECAEAGLVERVGDLLRLTRNGRMASNEVFGRLLVRQA